MSQMQMPMPADPTWFDELQAALFPWFGYPDGWDEILRGMDGPGGIDGPCG